MCLSFICGFFLLFLFFFFFFQAEDGIRDWSVTGVQTCALPISVRAARDAFANGWSNLRPSERAKYLFRIARLLQERSREFAVLESLNGGKPIRESRDVDIPLRSEERRVGKECRSRWQQER